MEVASDLGGAAGHGAVLAEQDEPVFHAEWERRVLAMTLAMGATGTRTLDQSRFAREDRPRQEYLELTYYELWLAALERLLVDHHLVSVTELRSGEVLSDPAVIERCLRASEVPAVLRHGGPTVRPSRSAARFGIGSAVRTKSVDPSWHTRLPSYARGKSGVVSRLHGCHVFPDSHAHGCGEAPQWLYTVEFSAVELFGPAADPRSTVSIDAFEPYLETV